MNDAVFVKWEPEDFGLPMNERSVSMAFQILSL